MVYIWVPVCDYNSQNLHLQEDLQLTERNGQHHLIGLVSLGGLYENMKLIETGY
jgi:hypothetical protein